MRWWMITAAVLVLGAANAHAAQPKPGPVNAALKKYVGGGRVDYAAWKKDDQGLNRWLKAAARVSRDEFDSWKVSEQMAFLINVYNFNTIRLILDHYPVDSIKDIGSFLKGPWKQEVVDLFGEKTTLDHVEHGLLRPMGDARIHFAVNCASIGCPPLADRAYRADRLDKQLDKAAKAFLADSSYNRFDVKERTIEVSSIFKWFRGDFERDAGTLRKYLSRFAPKEAFTLLADDEVDIDFADYDWGLNDRVRGEK